MLILTLVIRNGRRRKALDCMSKSVQTLISEQKHLAIEDTDAIINAFYENLYSEGSDKPLLDDMSIEEKKAFAKKEAELINEPELQQLDKVVDQQTNMLAHTNGEQVHEGVAMMNGESAAAR